jgi:CIC family chloride channel protein
MRTLVGCGAAAGVAATFNAPIAGSMFALEVILGDFGLATFSPIIISSVTATAISRHFLGDIPAFIVPAHKLVSLWEFPLYLLLGLFCAIVAVTFTKMLYYTEDLFDGLKFPEYLKAVLGGAVIGLMGLLLPHLLGVGYGAIDQSLMGLASWWLLLLLIPCKILATSITIGSGGSGGIFAPSLFLGAMSGSLFGIGVHTLFPGITATPGAYGLVGMAAVVSGTTHGPLTAILIIFEMTGDYKIILPLMATCIISALAGGQFMKESIYTLKLIRRGIDIREGKEVNVLRSISVRDVMNPKVETIQESLTMGSLSEIVSKSKHNSFPVLNTEGDLTGMLSYMDYREAVFDESLKDLVVVKELASPKVVSVTGEDNLYDALGKISVRDFSLLPVVASDSPKKLLGVLSRRDIMGAYTKAVIKKSLLIRPDKKE